MPRNVSDIYFIPPGTEGFPDTTIESEKYNNYIHDVETDLNRPRPISAGGTGANDADEALANLHAEKAGQEVTNFDTHVWIAGSFFSKITTTAPPVAGHLFSGIAHITDANNMVVEAVDLTDSLHKSYMRVKTAGVWGAWEGVSIVTCSDTPPTGNRASDNALWWESDTGLLYIRYNDGDSSQWTITCPQPDISTYAIKTEVTDDISSAIDAKAVRYDTLQTLASAQQAQARGNIGVPEAAIASCANSIINGDFRVNQGGYVSATALSAGSYGHDQWKAGASGGDYSFAQLKSSTQVTIASGKSLIQPIEDLNVSGGPYVLSWTGTAQARAGVNTLTPSGSYAGSPLLITGQTAGTAMSVEFNSGTLGTVKLENGFVATPFVMQPYDQELLTCMRYYEAFPAGGGPGIYAPLAVGQAASATLAQLTVFFRVIKRATPVATTSPGSDFVLLGPTGAPIPVTLMHPGNGGTGSMYFTADVAGGLVAGNATALYQYGDSVAKFHWSARL